MNVKLHYPAKEYNGNEARKILKQFAGLPEDNNVFGTDLLKSAALIEQFAVARELTEEEIKSFGDAIDAFFDLLIQKHPSFPRKKTKLHVLQFHVMPLVRNFKSWGKFSEQCE